jgi:hypothetical protein
MALSLMDLIVTLIILLQFGIKTYLANIGLQWVRLKFSLSIEQSGEKIFLLYFLHLG